MQYRLMLTILYALIFASSILASTPSPVATPTPTPDPNVFYSGYYKFSELSADTRLNHNCTVRFLQLEYLSCWPSESIEFTVNADFVVIYTYTDVGNRAFEICVDSDCYDFPNINIGTHYQYPYAALSLPTGNVTIRLNATGSYPYFFSFMLFPSGGNTGSPSSPTTFIIEPPVDLASSYSNLEGQTVRFDYAMSAGELVIALLIFSLLCLRGISLVFNNNERKVYK